MSCWMYSCTAKGPVFSENSSKSLFILPVPHIFSFSAYQISFNFLHYNDQNFEEKLCEETQLKQSLKNP